jgi:tRNA A37 threonylcarbamoyladenosine biosynthesis protein TsaE
MTLCEKAVQTLVEHGFNATISSDLGSLILVKYHDKKVILHHFDVYEFLNKHDNKGKLCQSN